jgi:hypothetical protein
VRFTMKMIKIFCMTHYMTIFFLNYEGIYTC